MRARADAHAPYRDLVATRLDRPLTRIELRRLNAHLKHCDVCQQAEADYRTQRTLLRALPSPLPPRDMWARTSAALDREVARGVRASWSRRLRRAQRRARPTAGMVTVLAALGIVTALATFQLSPTRLPPTGASVRPTPFAVRPEPLAFVGLSSGDMAIYRTVIRQVCPQSEPIDCVATESIERTPLGTSLPDDIHAGNIALSPNGRQLSLVGRNVEADVIAVVLMPDDVEGPPNPTKSVGFDDPTEKPETPRAATDPPGPTDTPAPTDPPEPTDPPATNEPPATTEPSATAALETLAPPTERPTTDPAATAAARSTPTPTVPDATPAATESTSPTVASPTDAPPTDEPATAEPSLSASAPPESAVPGLRVVNILDGVRSAGAPPAWSHNGDMLAFSAMPVDGSHGPDVYLWSPGDEKARAVTSDHGSYFASWSGNRIVVSRLSVGEGGDVTPNTVVIDPRTSEERPVSSPLVWLPAVSRDRSRAIVWSGDLTVHEGRPSARSGALYVMDWSQVDPFRLAAPEDSADDPLESAEADPNQPSATPETDEPVSDAVVELVPLEPGRSSSSVPVVDWLARWSPDSRVLGIWIADSEGSNWGRLAVLPVDPDTHRVLRSQPLLETTLARRGFSLGSDRVAWVAPTDANVDGELRIRAWTDDGVGGLRVISPDEEVLPAL